MRVKHWILAAALGTAMVALLTVASGPSADRTDAQIFRNADQVLNGVFDATNSVLNMKGPVVQLPALNNSVSTSSANSPVSKAITGASGKSAYLYHLEARCSAGTAQLTVQDGATTIFQSGSAEVGTSSYVRDFGTPLAATAGSTLTITLGACGSSNTGTLVVQASQF